jgi:hypothetical protein
MIFKILFLLYYDSLAKTGRGFSAIDDWWDALSTSEQWVFKLGCFLVMFVMFMICTRDK